MRAAPRRSSSSRRLSAFDSRSFRLSSRLAARLATAVTSFRCSSSKGVSPAGPSSTTQPAARCSSPPPPPNQSGAHSTARTLPSPLSTRGARKAAGARSARSATAGSIVHAASPSIARAAPTAISSGSPSKSATAPRLAGTASSTWPSRVSSSSGAFGVATTAAAARVSTLRIRLWRATFSVSTYERVARSVTSRSRASATFASGSDGSSASR